MTFSHFSPPKNTVSILTKCSNVRKRRRRRRQRIRTGFKVVVDDGRSDLVEVLEGVDDLHDDGAALLLRHELVLLQVEVQVVALAVLQHGAEPAR